MSVDGFCAGPDQSLEHPLGVGGGTLHQWFLPTETFQKMHTGGTGETGLDNDMAKRAFVNVGACIMGRNMFGPVRGPWLNEDWKGWWGENPPFHCPVYILTNHPRPSIPMEGGTTFHFVTDGIHSALEKARQSAGDKDVLLSGGTSTVQQYLRERLIDQMHIAVSPVVLGSGERLFDGIDLPKLGYKLSSHTNSQKAMHIMIDRCE